MNDRRASGGVLRSVGMVLSGTLLLVPFLWRLDRGSFHLDETTWILASVILADSLVGDSTDPDEWEQFGFAFGWPSPPLGKYLIAGSIRVREGASTTALEGIRMASYDRPMFASIAARQTPPRALLVSARLPMAILGASTCLVVFFIGRRAWGARAGVIATTLLALNPLMLVCTRRAMVDASALFFSALTVLVAGYLLDRGNVAGSEAGRVRGVVPGLLLGLVAGLAVGSKFNALATFVACAASIGVGILFIRHRLPMLVCLLVAVLIAGVVFIAINPYLYSEPLLRTWQMLTFKHWEPDIVDPVERAGMVLKRVLLGATDPQGAIYLTLRSLLRLPLEWLLVPIGLGVMTAAIPGVLRRHGGGTKRISWMEPTVIAWWLATMGAIAVWLPKDWERYYLPAVVPTCLIAARGADWILSRLVTLLRSGLARRTLQGVSIE